MLEDAIILCGNCLSAAVWLEKVKLTGTTNDIISKNIKKDAAVKYPIHRNVPLNIVEESYLRVRYWQSKVFPLLICIVLLKVKYLANKTTYYFLYPEIEVIKRGGKKEKENGYSDEQRHSGNCN